MGTTYEEFLASLTDPKKIEMVNDADLFFRQVKKHLASVVLPDEPTNENLLMMERERLAYYTLCHSEDKECIQRISRRIEELTKLIAWEDERKIRDAEMRRRRNRIIFEIADLEFDPEEGEME